MRCANKCALCARQGGSMKHLKSLCLIAVAVAGLMALVGSSMASATVLCKNNLNTSSCSERYPVGTEFKTTLVGTATLTTSFKNVSCEEASGNGKLETEGSGTSTPGGIGTGTYSKCGCEVKVLKTGRIEVHHITGTDNGTVTFSGTEVTTNCSTIFGNVHCIYVTNSTDVGALESGNPASVKINSADIPRASTNALCDETANLDATFEITAPKPLYVAAS
jgi:hypothetical protein